MHFTFFLYSSEVHLDWFEKMVSSSWSYTQKYLNKASLTSVNLTIMQPLWLAGTCCFLPDSQRPYREPSTQGAEPGEEFGELTAGVCSDHAWSSNNDNVQKTKLMFYFKIFTQTSKASRGTHKAGTATQLCNCKNFLFRGQSEDGHQEFFTVCPLPKGFPQPADL